MRSLSTRRGALPSPSGPERAEPSSSASFTHFEALFPLRVRSRRARLPRTDGRSSPGFRSSLEPCPPHLGACLTRPRPEGTDTALSRRIGRATRRTSQPLAPGETSPVPRGNRLEPLGGFRPLEGRPEPPLGGSPAPLALGHRAHPEPRPSKRRSMWRVACLRRDRRLFRGFLPPRLPRDYEARAGPGV
jgi:hypothetical protein